MLVIPSRYKDGQMHGDEKMKSAGANKQAPAIIVTIFSVYNHPIIDLLLKKFSVAILLIKMVGLQSEAWVIIINKF